MNIRLIVFTWLQMKIFLFLYFYVAIRAWNHEFMISPLKVNLKEHRETLIDLNYLKIEVHLHNNKLFLQISFCFRLFLFKNSLMKQSRKKFLDLESMNT